VLECVINISEGQNIALLTDLAHTVSDHLLDVHTDSEHHRSVFTMIGVEAAQTLTRAAVNALSLENHAGVHPRFGVVDVVPFVPLVGSTMTNAIEARNDFAQWAADVLEVPCFLYGPEQSLPHIRKHAWRDVLPDFGPRVPHPTAGAICVGAREPLIAYNVWLRNIDLTHTKNIAAQVRTNELRTLGLQVGDFTQVSMNLIKPDFVGPMQAYHAVAERVKIDRAELVGLLPAVVLAEIPRDRWEQLDLSVEKTIEWRLTHRP
jgi:glutamate formiminotransferase